MPLQQVSIVELPRPPKGRGEVAPDDFARLLAPAIAGNDLGLLSEAGLAALADPGARLVAAAHAAGLRVVALPGASSIALAVAASGLNGQSFAFVGYLPIEAAARSARIRELEAASRRQGQTQVMIETPYRNPALLAALVAELQPTTQLSVSVGLTLASECDAQRQRRALARGAERRARRRAGGVFVPGALSAGEPAQESAVSGTLPPNSAATFFFGLMLGDRPRPTGAARFSHAGSAVVALAS